VIRKILFASASGAYTVLVGTMAEYLNVSASFSAFQTSSNQEDRAIELRQASTHGKSLRRTTARGGVQVRQILERAAVGARSPAKKCFNGTHPAEADIRYSHTAC
jgi:hypothetical protein